MVIEIKKPITKEKIEEALRKLKTRKKTAKSGNLAQFFGITKKGPDPLKIQKKLRNEWL